MPKVRFNLHNPKENPTRIRLVFNYPGGRLVYYPGEFVSPGCWNKKDMRVRNKSGCPNANLINHKLNLFEDKVQAIQLDYFNRGEALTPETFRAELRAWQQDRVLEREQAVSLFEFFDLLIDERRYNPDYASGTITVYKTTLKKLKDYHTATRRKVDFDTIDLEFSNRFAAWMADTFRPNYINKVLGTLKTFMNEAVDRGLTQNRAFQSRRFNVKKEAVDHIYLNESEIALIAKAELDERLDRVRDLFLLGCYTGLRFIDYGEIKPENIKTVEGVEMIGVLTQKTRKQVFIPLFPEAKKILEKRGGRPPDGMSNQKMNAYLKELCELVGLDTPVTQSRFVKGVRVSKTVPKFKLVATHTARRSFASNEYLRAIKAGRSYKPIMDITGHLTEKEFFKYIRIAAESKAIAFARGRTA